MTDLDAPRFESLARQRLAARLGTWTFLASEVLLFTGLFALYASGRAEHARAFDYGITHAMVVVGTVNTFVLLTSSFCLARACLALRGGSVRLAAILVGVTALLGVAFLALKGYEYHQHIAEGQVPGGRSAYFASHADLDGLPLYYTLYWVSTGAHAVHVTIGVVLLGVFAIAIARDRVPPARAYRLENAALYWHLVDAVWVFLWPLYYLR
ncbi:MAG: cytochrome c oxidase subunit 3 [Sandaracinaceae bacterium]